MSLSRTTSGQTAVEFTFMVAFALIMGAIFLSSVASTFSDAAEKERIASLNDVGYTIQDEVVLATLVQDGYSRTFTIPKKAGRFVYEISSTALGVTLSSSGTVITYPIPEVTGTFDKGENDISKSGTVIIS